MKKQLIIVVFVLVGIFLVGCAELPLFDRTNATIVVSTESYSSKNFVETSGYFPEGERVRYHLRNMPTDACLINSSYWVPCSKLQLDMGVPFANDSGPTQTSETTTNLSSKPKPTRTIRSCEKAVMAAAAIPDSKDSFNDLDEAIRICKSWGEFGAAVRKHPRAWASALGDPGSVDLLIGARMSCTDERLHNTPVCKKAHEGVIFD